MCILETIQVSIHLYYFQVCLDYSYYPEGRLAMKFNLLAHLLISQLPTRESKQLTKLKNWFGAATAVSHELHILSRYGCRLTNRA